jgi:hypothetical protein
LPKEAPKVEQADLGALTRDLMPETRAIFSKLRSLVTSTLPEATEKVTLTRMRLNFSHPNVGYFCGLSPEDGRTTLEFEFGVLLPDPQGILTGNSCAKQVRYARFDAVTTLPLNGLQQLLRAAVSLPQERSTRIALARSGAKLVLPNQRRPKRRRSSPRAA